MRSALLAVAGLVLLGADDPKAALQELLPVEERVIDRAARPEAGRRITVEAGDTHGCVTETHFERFAKAKDANDGVGLKRLLGEGGGVFSIPKGTEVLVIKAMRPKPIQRNSVGLSGSDVGQSIQRAINSQLGDKTDYPVEVRIQSGPLKDKVLFVPESGLTVFKSLGTPRAYTHIVGKRSRLEPFERPAVDVDSDDRSAKADAMLKAGETFERRENFKAAIGAYWFLMVDHKDLPQAETAAIRLKRMGFSRKSSVNYEFNFSRRSKAK